MKNRDGHRGLRTWIEIDRKAIKHNFGVFRSLIPKRTKLMAVVKSNAYGHGLVGFSREMERLGAECLGVDSMVEALALRREGIKLPILVLGYTLPEMLESAAKENISLTVSGQEALKHIAKLGRLVKPLKIHIKVDTGMHRQGFLLRDVKKTLVGVRNAIHDSYIEIEGLYTHFASAKNPAFPRDTHRQLAEFRKWIAAFKREGLNPIAHASASSGTMLFHESHFGMIRVGIGLYGLWPAKEVKEYLKDRFILKPALAWKSIITEVKRLPKGSRIGYDLTEALPYNGTVGVVPIGYWHGYPRALSSIGRVLVGGGEAKVLGRVSMDMIVVDLTDISGVKVGDEVILIGKKGRLKVSVDDLACLTDGSSYEIVTRLNPCMKRFYI